MIRKNSQSGFTLVEMMVIAGVISVLAVGFASYMFQQTKQLRSGQSRDNVEQVQINVVSAASQPDQILAAESLQSKALPNVNIPCSNPCSVGLDEGNAYDCVYDCRIPKLSQGACGSMPTGCKIIYLAFCSCPSGGGGGHTTM